MWRQIVASTLLLTLLSGLGKARADESYFMIIFGQQDEANRPALAHTFATFIKATGTGPDKTKYTLEPHTISWLPRQLDVKVLAKPEAGVNLDLKTTLQRAKEMKVHVSMWGPFAIKKELYARALRQESRL